MSDDNASNNTGDIDGTVDNCLYKIAYKLHEYLSLHDAKFDIVRVNIQRFKEKRIAQNKIPRLEAMVNKIYKQQHNMYCNSFFLKHQLNHRHDYQDDEMLSNLRELFMPIIHVELKVFIFLKEEYVPHVRLYKLKKHVFVKNTCTACGEVKTITDNFNNCSHLLCPKCYIQCDLKCSQCNTF